MGYTRWASSSSSMQGSKDERGRNGMDGVGQVTRRMESWRVLKGACLLLGASLSDDGRTNERVVDCCGWRRTLNDDAQLSEWVRDCEKRGNGGAAGWQAGRLSVHTYAPQHWIFKLVAHAPSPSNDVPFINFAHAMFTYAWLVGHTHGP